MLSAMPQLSPHNLLTLCVGIFTIILLLSILTHTQLTKGLEKSTDKRSAIILCRNALDVISPQEKLLTTPDYNRAHI